VYGDGLSLGGFKYGLLLVDVATRYCWIYGLQTLSSKEIVSRFEQFVVDADGLPKTFHTDFDKKLIGGDAQRWMISQKIRLVAANASRQSSNGLVERTWQSIVRMSRAFVTEKQMGREFWFYAVQHSVMILLIKCWAAWAAHSPLHSSLCMASNRILKPGLSFSLLASSSTLSLAAMAPIPKQWKCR
jgi:hypothetical protein